MTKIREIIQINSGYTSYVDVYAEYNDLEKNRWRMARYKPITAHRQVFEKIANALNPLDRRCYFLSGSYGTGKSHILLMLANYFANPSDVPELEAFFKNYEVAQSEVLRKPGEELKERKAASLKEARKSGRYLVAICRFDLNLDFEGAVLRALKESLADESDILLDTHYREALRRISDWQTRRDETRFLTDLETAISRLYPGWTINDLIDGLEKFDEQALKAFKNCFQSVTDSEFSYKKDNLRDIISDFLKNPEFKANYKGIVFLYDEFGDAIDKNLVIYSTLLDFAQFCASSTLEKGGAVIFIGTGHKAFRSHGQIGDLNAETLEARVTEIGLMTQGMEDLIASIVQPMKERPEWNQYVQSQAGKFTWFSSECNRLRLFNWLPAPKINHNIIQNIYPMHPLATYALLKLAGDAGSANRSVTKFFAPEFETGEQGWINVQDQSYPWFIENHEIIEQKKLALYTPDLLIDYFKDDLNATKTHLVDKVKSAIINYEATLRELNAYLARKSEQQLFEEIDELMLRIIKVMLINEIASTQEAPIANTAQNIEFALDAVSTEEKTQVENRLNLLAKAGILYNNNGVYELLPGDRKDIQRVVEQFKANPDNRPTNLLDCFLELNPLKNDEVYLDAKGYNDTFSEDKRLKVHFASPAMLLEKHTVSGESLPYFAALEQERKQIAGATNGYEGSAVYVFCENENDVDQAKKVVAKNDQPRVVIAVPRNPINVYGAIFTLKALESDWFKKQAQNFSPYEKTEGKKIRDEATKVLDDAKKAYFSNSIVFWFGVKATEIPVKEDKRHDAARWMMQELYGTKRNTFGHLEFNKKHINLGGQVRAVFKEAGDILCDLSQPIRINWTWADNRGSTKYLRKCFVEHQALSISSSEGDTRYLESEKNLNKFRTAMPAYAKLLEDIATLEGKGQVNLLQFLKPYYQEYGQGDIAITLMLLLARRFYGDSMRFKREPIALTDIQFASTEDLLNLVQGQSPSAVILFEPVSPEDQAYFAKVTQIFTNQPSPAGKVYTVNEAFQAITNWWNDLPIIARSLGFYEKDDKPLAEVLSQAKTKDPFRYIKHELLELLGQTPGEILSAAKLMPIEMRLKTFKTMTEGVQETVEKRILVEIAKVFEAASNLDVDIQEAMKNWHNGLSTTQKDYVGYTFHNNDSKPLVKFTTYANIHELLFVTLPEAYSHGKVSDWTSDDVSAYVQQIRNGKAHIETNAPHGTLQVEFENKVAQNGNQVKYKGVLILRADTEDGQGEIYYTEDGSDPATSKQRHELNPGDKLTIKGNHKVKFVVSDEKGNFSAVQTYEVIDELEPFTIKRSQQQTSFVDEAITFVFPKTKDAAQVTIGSFIKTLSESGLFTEAELKKVIQNALDSLKKSQ